MGSMQSMECKCCAQERNRRARLLAKNDTCLQREPYVSVPYIHKNNQPKYHAMLLRAAEDAKRKREYTLWFAATDEPGNPAQVTKSPNKLQKRLEAFLQFHDQNSWHPGTQSHLQWDGRKGHRKNSQRERSDNIKTHAMHCCRMGSPQHRPHSGYR